MFTIACKTHHTTIAKWKQPNRINNDLAKNIRKIRYFCHTYIPLGLVVAIHQGPWLVLPYHKET